MNPKTTAMQYG